MSNRTFGPLLWRAPQSIRTITELFPAGEVIFGQGDAADAFYLVYSGVVSIDRSWRGGAPRHLGRCEPHACFGEQGILESEPRLAAATALEDSVVLRFPRAKFERLVADGNPTAVKLTLQLARTISKRLRNHIMSIEQWMLAFNTPPNVGV